MRIAFRKVSAVLLTTVLLFTTIFSLSVFVGRAATFTPRLTAPASTNKYYYNSNYNVFLKYGYGMPNCTAYAYGRAYEILGTAPKLSWNSAEEWYGYNKSGGYYKYGKTPKVGAIACWSYSGGGHVAVVEKIDSNGNMTLSNSEWGGRTFYLTTAKTTDSNPGGNSWWTFQGYIYLLDSADVVDTGYKPGVYKTNLTSGYLNFRSGAGTSYSVIGQIYNGVTLTVTKIKEADGNTWGYTTYNGKNGWVALEYCIYVSPLPEPTTVAPTTVKPTTAPPTTVAPTTVAPTTVAPTTVPPTTVPPTTVAPTTVPPTTVAPSTAATEPDEDDYEELPTLAYSKGLGVGDVDGNGKIDIQDATCIQKYLAYLLSLNDEQISWCDFDFDGIVSIYDVSYMQRHLANNY